LFSFIYDKQSGLAITKANIRFGGVVLMRFLVRAMMSFVAESMPHRRLLTMLHGVRIGVESDLAVGVAQPFADNEKRYAVAQHHRGIEMPQ